MTCQEFTEAATDYLEADLRFTHWLHYEMHLCMCLGCRIYLRQTKHTVRALRLLPAKPVPPAVRDALLQRFRAWKPS